MKATLIFDCVNDLLFHKWDENFINRMKSFNGQVSPIPVLKKGFTITLPIHIYYELMLRRQKSS